MVQRTTVVLVDDTDGAEADETIIFGLDGRGYEIDLTAANAGKLREIFAPYINAGRKVANASRARATSGGSAAAGEDPAAIRAWARSRGIELSSRGRIPAEVMAQFRAQN